MRTFSRRIHAAVAVLTASLLFALPIQAIAEDTFSASDTSIAVFKVNDRDVQDGGVLRLDPLTSDVDVTVVPTNPDATVEVEGDFDLQTFENTLTVFVTAPDETTREYKVTLFVPLNNDTTLSEVTVDGFVVEVGDEVNLDFLTDSVIVDVETTDPEATFEVDGDTGLVPGLNKLTITVVAADGETTGTYEINLKVALSDDGFLSVFQVNGADVEDGSTIDLDPLTTEVAVDVETSDPGATYEISGGQNLEAGENTLTVTVTAPDGSTSEYVVILNVMSSYDPSLAIFQVNGEDVEDGGVVELEVTATEVEVVVETTDSEATFEIIGGKNLVAGENQLVVRVTAADGETRAEFRVTIVVPSNDTSVRSITVNGVVTNVGDVVTVDNEVTSVEVEVETTNEAATFEVSGHEDLAEGDNLVTVTVTAQDGSTREYTFTVRVGGASADTSLTSLTLNGVEVAEGATVQLRSRTTSVNVAAVTRDPAASVRITGRTGLQVGSNDVVITITAPDRRTTRVVTIVAVVAPLSSNTNLSIFTVNGQAVSDNQIVQLAPLTRSVTVVAATEDAESVVLVSGRTGLADGSNTLTATVTAASGAVQIYTVTLVVRVLSTDVTLSTFTVKGLAPVNNLVEVPAGTLSVPVIATPTSSLSTVTISGNTGLRTGDNVVTVLVIAESGATRTYRVTVRVNLSDNTALRTLQVNGVDAYPGSTVTLPRGTRVVSVRAVPLEPEAQALVTGANQLSSGENTLTVRVTAPNGITVTNYTVTLFVTPRSGETGLRSINVNGSPVLENGTVTVPALTTAVIVETLTTDPEATASVSGATGLRDGENPVSITVTAANGTTRNYNFTVRVLVLSSDTTLRSPLLVNSESYTSGVVSVAFGTRSINVVAVTNDAAASFVVIGSNALRTGDNNVIVRVTAANGATADYVVQVKVLKSANTALTALSVNGQDALTGSTITVPARTALALVQAVTADPEATVAVSGTALLPGQNNVVSVLVTAADRTTTRTVSVNVFVTPLSSDSTYRSLQVNGLEYTGQVNLPVGSRSVPVIAVANDAGASVQVTGNSDLVAGSNDVSVKITAANGSFTIYTVVVFVASRSTNANISTAAGTWTINGVDVAVEGTIVELTPGQTAVSASARPSDSSATISITGTSGLITGLNQIKFTVTAEDGVTVVEYVRSVRVTELSSNTNLTSLTVAGSLTVSGGIVNVPSGTTAVSVIPVTESPEARFTVTGNTALGPGANTVLVTVTAPSGAETVNTVTVQVAAAASNTNLRTFAVNGISVTNGSTINVPAGTNRLSVRALVEDTRASVQIFGRSGLVTGTNTLTVVVTAISGATTTYTVTVNVAG